MIQKLQDGIIFISMPYSSKLPSDEDKLKERIERFEKSLKLLSYLQMNGVHVVSPITQEHPVVLKYEVPSDWKYWADYCQKLISVSNAIIVFTIPGWDTSTGVAEEIECAKKMKKDVYFIDEEFNLNN